MAGAITAEDATTPEPEACAGASNRFDPMIELLSQPEAARAVAPVPGFALHILLLGVADEFTGRGVAQGLVRACVAHAADRGYRRVFTEASNLVSQRVFANLGFMTAAYASYGEFRRNGEAPFASIADVGGPMKMVLDLGPGTG